MNRAEIDSPAGSEDSTQKGSMSGSYYAVDSSNQNIAQDNFNDNTVDLSDAKFSTDGDNVSFDDEPSLNQSQINELFDGLNVHAQFDKLQNTEPLSVSNSISQNNTRQFDSSR